MQFRSLPGQISYEQARRLQAELVDARSRDAIEDTVLFLEHDPVITRGRGLQFSGKGGLRHMPLPAELPSGIALVDSERGGDLTYHGPGQLVIYPIVKLDGTGWGPARDVALYLRKLEGVLIEVLGGLGLEGSSRENATGVWVGSRKVASIGVAVRKWVTYHGAAINCVNDLSPFRLISPCGFDPEVMASLSELSPSFGGPEWRSELEDRIAGKMGGARAVVTRGFAGY